MNTDTITGASSKGGAGDARHGMGVAQASRAAPHTPRRNKIHAREGRRRNILRSGREQQMPESVLIYGKDT